MIRTGAVIFFVLLSLEISGQTRLSKLILRPKEVYELKETDILVVDSLIMMDSSKIILNKLKPDNFIHAKGAVFFRGSMILGKGVVGIKGRDGRNGTSPSSPCTDGGQGLTGSEGTYGGMGTNLSLYFADVKFKGPLTIDVSGGNAGDGGKGGAGGGGGQGTRPCKGGNGGSGGTGANGGNGGNGGTVTFNAARIPEMRSMLGSQIIIRNYGGDHGLGGEGGAAGYSGLSPVGNSKMDGKMGRKGLKGKDGLQGKPGSINFQEK